MRKLVESVEAHAHHRNGVSGASFTVTIFRSEGQRMIGIQFPRFRECTAVLDLDLAAQGEIRFMHNSWRGDLFEVELAEIEEERK